VAVFLRTALLVSATSDCPYAFPALYHVQGLFPKGLLELKATNEIYENYGGRGKKFFSYPKRPDSYASPPPIPRERRVLLFPRAQQPGHENDS
jgi:hypothetical protein